MASNAENLNTPDVIAVPNADREGALLWGIALRVLRTRASLTLADAGAKIGITGQGWSAYETGKSPSIFRPSVQRKFGEALGYHALALEEEHARVVAANAVPGDPGPPDARP